MKLSELLSPIPPDEELVKCFPHARKKGTPYITNQDLLILSLYLDGWELKEIAERANLKVQPQAIKYRIRKIHRILRFQVEIDMDVSRIVPKTGKQALPPLPQPERPCLEQLKYERDQLALYICTHIAVDILDCRDTIRAEYCPYSRSHNRMDCIRCVVEHIAAG